MTVTLHHERDELRKRFGKATRRLERLAALEDITRRSAPSAQLHRVTATRRWAVEARLANRAQRLRLAMREAGAVYLPERLHGSLALKKLRYAVEFSAEIEIRTRRAQPCAC